MFTGIIQSTGRVKKTEKNNQGGLILSVEVKNFLKNIKIGDSLAVDGICLTVIKKSKNSFQTEVIPETLSRTIAPEYKKGSVVNLEKSLKIGDRLDGHFVPGHVDGVGRLAKVTKVRDYLVWEIKPPVEILKYLAYKGSVAINGVSLTISRLNKNSFEVSLISHTLENTNLSELQPGFKVNIEADVIARYLEKLVVSS
ncbi:MAG TPA: riboflavin synthase [Patescibacteria group bacterium]